MTIDTSIVIVSWNTRDILRDCLRSISENTDTLRYEIIVVDNASDGDSVEMVRREFPQVHLIENADNRGFAAANNQGIAVARGRYVLLLNSDTIVLGQAIAKTVSFADAHPDAGVVGCRVLNADRTLQPTCFMFPSLLNMVLAATYLYKLLPRNRFFGREQMTWWDRTDVREVEVVTGCFMLARKEAIDQVGGMDEGFFMYGEETDWCYRFHKAGWKTLFTPAGQIIHLGGQSTKRVRVDMLIQLRMSILLFLKKHCGWVKYHLACSLVLGFFVVRIPIWGGVALIRPRERTNAIAKLKAYCVGTGRILHHMAFPPCTESQA